MGAPEAASATVTDRDTEPPAPAQLSVNVVAAVSAPVLALPDVAFAPLQPSEAVQVVALAAVQESVLELPDATEAGLADKVRVTAGGATTVTATDELADPPLPLQDMEYVAVDAGVTMSDPLTAREPVHAPEVVQVEALAEFHVSVLLPPEVIEPGDAARFRVGVGAGGGGAADTVTEVEFVALPPAPVQFSV